MARLGPGFRPLDMQVAACVSSTLVSDDVYRAIADPTRRAVLDELTERSGQTLFELCARLAMRHGLGSTRQAISQHLDVLEGAGLIRTERRGRYKLIYIDTAPLREIVERWPVTGERE